MNVKADCSRVILRASYGTQKRNSSSRRRAAQSAGADFPAESSEVSDASGTPQQQEVRLELFTRYGVLSKLLWRNFEAQGCDGVPNRE